MLRRSAHPRRAHALCNSAGIPHLPCPSGAACQALTMFFFFNDTATTEIYTLSLHDALPIWRCVVRGSLTSADHRFAFGAGPRSEEHTSELQSHHDLVCRLLLEKKKAASARAGNAARAAKTAAANPRSYVPGALAASRIDSAR